MKFIIYCLLFQIGITSTKSQSSNKVNSSIEELKVNDTAYVWSNFNATLYVKPNQISKKIGQLKLGDQVVIEKVNLNDYNIKLIDTIWCYKDYLEIKNAPLISYGSWIKIKTLNGEKGYILDHVISKIKPEFKKCKQNILLLNPIQIDTILIDSTSRNYTISEISYEFEYQIIMTVKSYMYRSIEIEFGSIGKETIWKLMSNYTERYKGFAVTRNWPNQVFFNDSENYCNYKLIKKDKVFKMQIRCNC